MTAWGLIDSYAIQFAIFGIISVLLLVLARGKFKKWFIGNTADESESKPSFGKDIGDRVTVVDDFSQGHGRVVLNGVKWDADSDDDLIAGEMAWVINNEGIRLIVARNKP